MADYMVINVLSAISGIRVSSRPLSIYPPPPLSIERWGYSKRGYEHTGITTTPHFIQSIVV